MVSSRRRFRGCARCWLALTGILICWHGSVWKGGGFVLQSIEASPIQSNSNSNRYQADSKRRTTTIDVPEEAEPKESTGTSAVSSSSVMTRRTAQQESISNSKGMHKPESLKIRPRVVSLNIMVAGLAGMGKTTLCRALLDAWWHEIHETENEMASQGDSKSKTAGAKKNNSGRFFKSPFSSSTTTAAPAKTSSATFGSTTAIRPSAPFEYFDEGANTILRVRIIDTPGFGNRVNHRNSVKPITDYISNCRLERFRREQSPSHQKSSTAVPTTSNPQDHEQADQLVHVCLYFLSPGRFLAIDRHFLKKVQEEVTIVPVIAKADTLTDAEIARYRAELDQIWRDESINVYSLDDNGNDDKNPTRKARRSAIHSAIANDQHKKFHRGRRPGEVLAIVSRDGIYPWGDSCALDPEHSDLVLIRDSLLSEHTERFLALASEKYNTFRNQQLALRKRSDWLKFLALMGLATMQLSRMEITLGGGNTLSEIISKWSSAVLSLLPFEGASSSVRQSLARLRSPMRRKSLSNEEEDSKERSDDDDDLARNEDFPPHKSKLVFGFFGAPSYDSIFRRWQQRDDGDADDDDDGDTDEK